MSTTKKLSEQIIEYFLFFCAFITVLTTIGIVLVLAVNSYHFFSEVSFWDFITGTKWAPVISNDYGILPLLTGTLLTTLVAMIIALPIGLSIAIYLSQYATNQNRKIVKPLLELLAAVPTIVYGFFALTIVTPFLKTIYPELEIFNSLSAGIVMGIMIIPYVSSLSEDALFAVPKSLREAAFGLGSTKLQAAIRVVLPAASSGIIVSIILAISRAIGETMIVAIAAGQQPTFTINPTVAIQTITSYIVQISKGDVPRDSIAYNSIFAAGITLFVITFILNNISFYIKRKYQEQYD
jgi:phosphate transport system permease protein